jgi:hypothetical protein
MRHKPGTKTEKPPADATDAALQPSLPAAPAPTPIASFKGLDFFDWGAGWPPDTVGDVGPNHYIQAVNTSLGIYSKTGTQLAAFTFDNFFSGTGTPCDDSNNGDPIVNYDPLADRWIISDFAFVGDVGPYYQCFAVSKTNDPVAGGWWLYGIFIDDTELHDYPKLGVWPDGIYMSANMFDDVDGFVGVRVWAFNRDDLYSGAPVRQISFILDSNSWSLLPSNFRGTPPPPGTPNYFVSYQENFPQLTGNTLFVRKFSITSWSPAAATFTGPTNVTVAQYREPPYLAPTVPQLGGELLDSLGDRLMMQNQYRNINGVESLWNNHTVIVPSAGPQHAIRWYQLNVTGGTIATTPVQQSTYSPDTNFRWMGSLAVDKNGNMALGYSISSSAMFPAIRYAGRLATDPLNQLPQTETALINGDLSQTGGFNRWGDYSAMSVDPADDCTFWYTQEYLETSAEVQPPYTAAQAWQTRIGSFKFPSCVAAPVQLVSVVSRKVHGPAGPFNIGLPLTGDPGIECRTGGADNEHTVIFTFANPLTAVGGVSMTGTGDASGAIGTDPRQYIVNLEGVTTEQVIRINLTNVSDSAGRSSASVSVSMIVLAGDTNEDKRVNVGDTNQTRARAGQLTNNTNKRSDVNLDGRVNVGDTNFVRAHSGDFVP